MKRLLAVLSILAMIVMAIQVTFPVQALPSATAWGGPGDDPDTDADTVSDDGDDDGGDGGDDDDGSEPDE